ncbi:MAG: hypothetical protein IKU26_06400, partial [Clostridia bacterium]|nr:hypothetical protein [Clostridia bacterium]
MDQEIFRIQIADRLGGKVGNMLMKAVGLDPSLLTELTEIRLRIGRPVAIKRLSYSAFISTYGKTVQPRQAYFVTPEDISGVMNRICQYSRYAFQSDLKQGYVTIPGGHRIGIAGKMLQDGTI